MRKKLLAQLIKAEGLRLKPYRCSANKLTIGIGRNIEDRGISEEEAMFLCENDIDIVLHELNKNLPWFSASPENVQLVLADMCFNMGISRLLLFRRTLRFLEQKDYENAAVEMLDSTWAKQVKGRAGGLSSMIASLA